MECQKKKKTKTGWHIHLLKYKTERTTKGEKKQSNLFSSAHEAEVNLFNFCYQMESKRSKQLADQHALFLKDKCKHPPVSHTPVKKLHLFNYSAGSMTQNPGICCLPDAPLERNPMVPSTFNWYNSNQMEVFISQFAVKIQRGWMHNHHHHALL